MATSTGKKPAAKKKGVRKKSAVKKRSTKKTASKKTGSKKSAAKKAPRKWSKKVNEKSDALDLEQGIFKGNDPKKIAQSLKRSASRSKRKKTSPFQSAMSMLNFYENRGGKNLSTSKKKVLDDAKEELRKLFGKEE
ncbi:MAG: DUF3175 domain-containing protein [Flavisolibacter sp.]